jgi:hypothetical protein
MSKDLEVRKIPEGENPTCGCSATPRPALVYLNGSPSCASCFGAEILKGGEDSNALLGYLLSKLVDD